MVDGSEVITFPSIFTSDRACSVAEAGATVDEIVGQLVEAGTLHPAFIPSTRVVLVAEDGNEAVVPYEAWPRVRPNPGTRVVVRPVPQGGGGGGGGKSGGRMIGMIVIMVVAAAATYGASSAMIASAASSGGTFSAGGIALASGSMVNGAAVGSLPYCGRLVMGGVS